MNVQEIKKTPRPRYCGILVHPTSFPSPYGIGDLGDGAYAFIDFLYDAGQTLWQCLPLGPTGFGDSPYQAFSAFAGQPLLISPDLLLKDGLLEKNDLADVPDFNDYSVEYGNVITYKAALLRKACAHFTASEDKALHKAFNHFCRTEKDWLEDYALFMSLKDLHQGRSWHEWSPQYQVLDTRTRKAALTELADSITYYQFIQFIFFKQWHELKLYANKKGISVIGDIPIFVSPDSADVWANQSLFVIGRESREVCYEVLTAEQIAKLCCLVAFIAIPTTIIRPEVTGTGFFQWLSRLIYSMDSPDNLLPSVHCLENWICFRGAMKCKKVGKGYKIFTFVAAILVFASTLMVKQHVVLDVVAAIVVVELGLFLSRRFNLSKIYFIIEDRLFKKTN